MRKISPILATALLCLALSPSNVTANEPASKLTTLAKEYEKAGKYDEAIQVYRHILTIEPGRKEIVQRIEGLKQKQTSPSASGVRSPSAPSSVSKKLDTPRKGPAKPKSANASRTKDNRIIDAGYRELESGNYAAAMSHFQQILKRRPLNTLALKGKASIHERLGEWAQVKQTLSRKIKRINDPEINALYARAQENLKQGDSSVPKSSAAQIQERFDARFKEGELLLAKNDYSGALGIFHSLYLENPAHPGLLLRIAETYSRQNEFHKAQEYYATALSFSPRNLYAQEGLAQTYYALKEYAKAVQAYEKIDPKRWNETLEYNYKTAKTADLIEKKEYEKARIVAEELMQKYPQRDDAIRQLAELNARINPDEAIRLRTLIYQRTRSNSDLLPLIYALIDANRFTQAEVHFNSLMGKSLSPEEQIHFKKLYLVYYRKLAAVQLTDERFDAAERTARSGLLLAPGDAELSENLGWSLLNRSRPAEALRYFEQLLSSNPSEPLHYAAALSAYSAKEKQKAFSHLFKASKTTDIALLQKIAELYEIMGYKQESLDTLRQMEDAQMLGYPQPGHAAPLPSSPFPATEPKPSGNKDLNGVYNPFVSLSPALRTASPAQNVHPTAAQSGLSSHRVYQKLPAPPLQEDPLLGLKQKILAEKQHSLSGSFFFENRSGTEGIDRLSKTVIPLQATLVPAFNHTIHVGTNLHHLQTGTLEAADRTEIGFGTNGGGTLNIESMNATEPFVRYQYAKQPYTVEAALGSTPINDEIAHATWTGSLEGVWNTDSWKVGAKILKESISETLLSYVGQKDPDNGSAWGRVVRKGVEASFEQGGDLVTSVRLGYYPSITGINTLSNSQTKGSVFVGKKVIDEPSADFLVGPLLIADRFERSTNHFTYGHGGYFSPTSFLLASLYGDYTHWLEKSAFFRLKGTVGFSTFDESAEPRLPLSDPGGAFYASNSDSGFSANLKGMAGYRLEDDLHLFGMFGWSEAPQYRSLMAGVSLIYYFDTYAALSPNEINRFTYGRDAFK